MQVTVYHHLIANVEMEKGIIYPVAFFRDVPNYNGIFEATNSIDESWVRGKQDDMMIMLRSTSVGDLYKITTQAGTRPVWFKVGGFGENPFVAMTDEEVKEAFILTQPVTAESAERAQHIPEIREQLFR